MQTEAKITTEEGLKKYLSLESKKYNEINKEEILREQKKQYGYIGQLKIPFLMKLLLFGTMHRYNLQPIQIKYRVFRNWVKVKLGLEKINYAQQRWDISYETEKKCMNLASLITALNLRLTMEGDMPFSISAEPRPRLMEAYSEKQQQSYSQQCKIFMSRLQTSYDGF